MSPWKSKNSTVEEIGKGCSRGEPTIAGLEAVSRRPFRGRLHFVRWKAHFTYSVARDSSTLNGRLYGFLRGDGEEKREGPVTPGLYQKVKFCLLYGAN